MGTLLSSVAGDHGHRGLAERAVTYDNLAETYRVLTGDIP